jgi:DNA-binding transcriptional regulator YiaG
MKKENCINCQNQATVTRGSYRFDGVGLPLTLQNIELVKCDHCGTVDPIIPNMDELMHTIALAVVCSPCKLDGAQIKFLRTYVGKGSAEFAKLLHLDKTTMSKMENDSDRPVGDQTDRLIRFLVLNLSPELESKVKRLIEVLPDIQDCCPNERAEIRIDPATKLYQYAHA